MDQNPNLDLKNQTGLIGSKSFQITPSIRDGVLCSGMLLYLHLLREFKIFFYPAKFDNFKDEKISDFKPVSVSQRKNLLD